tara:strand:- start:6234 stop:7121 length:888 start_codon:yes stop_codon:yes gene_type:complete
MANAEILEAQLKLCLDRLSNGESVEVEDEWIEDAGEMFKDCLRKQLAPRPEEDFRIRMSNIGKPTCQLQREKEGAPKSRNEYNFIVKMMLGDATECIMEVLLKAAGLNITGGKEDVELKINSHTIKGQDDIHIDGAVFDTKSCSPYAFNNKWRAGISGLKDDDPFGYIKQMIGYSDAQGKPAGGWVVVNKSTGEVTIVGAEFSDKELEEHRREMADTVDLVFSDKPFKKCFDVELETTRGQMPTGSLKVPMGCTFCSYMKECWPNARYLPHTVSKAKNPKHYWYTEYGKDETSTN